jgi:hypothetical protein
VVFDGTHRVQSNKSICVWECCQEFFLVEWGCVNCSTQGLACPPGQLWQACSERADAGCTVCPDLPLAKGSYTANKQWAKGNKWLSKCIAGFYNNKTQYAEGRCRHCWDRTELALHAGLEQQFFALFACNGLEQQFFALFARVMHAGHRARRSRGRSSLEQRAFEWQPESCVINCLPPWLSTRARSSTAEDTCVLATRSMGSGKSKTRHAHSEKIHREIYTFRTSPY